MSFARFWDAGSSSRENAGAGAGWIGAGFAGIAEAAADCGPPI